MIFEPQPFVKFVSADVEVIGLQVQSFDAEFAASLNREIDRCLPNPLLAPLWLDVELIDETVASVKFERERESQDHVTDQLARVLKKDQSTETLIFDQLC